MNCIFCFGLSALPLCIISQLTITTVLSSLKVYGQDKIQFKFSSVSALNMCKIRLLLYVTFLGINFSFHAPWYAFSKQLKAWWRGVLPHFESNSFQPSLWHGTSMILQHLNLHSQHFNQLVVWTVFGEPANNLTPWLMRCCHGAVHQSNTRSQLFFAIFYLNRQLCFVCHF